MNRSSLPLISIVLCTYNGERHLKYQLDSLVAQTYKNIEIVIVDDCSDDNTRSILSDYLSRYAHINLFFNLENLGFNKNFEKAITLAKGEFISICDQDDIWDLDKIEELMANIGDKGMIFSNSRLIDEDGLSMNRLLLAAPNFNLLDYKSILINNFVAGHTILAKTIFIKKTLPFPDYGYYDWWIGFLAIYHQEIVFLDKCLTSYRIHSNSVIQKEVSSPDSVAITLTQYKTSSYHQEIFYDFLKKNNNESFMRPLVSLYSKKTNIIERKYILMFLIYHYNTLFPLHKRRRITSTTRFKIVDRYLKDVLECKLQVLGFI